MEYLSALIKLYEANRDPQSAVAMAKYMKDQFAFFGINSPERKQLDRKFYNAYGLPPIGELPEIVRQGFSKPQREIQYFTMSLAAKMLKQLPENFMDTAKFMIVTKSWWDTVDFITAWIVGGLIKKYPEQVKVMDQWVNEENMWLQRAAILHQLKYKAQTDKDRLFKYCKKHAGQNEFFIRKAIGWALREYSKYNPEGVREFVAKIELSNLSRKEALRLMEKKH